LPHAIGGPTARAALATPAIPLAVSGRPVAVALLVAGLAVLTALMIWVLERGGRTRAARDRASDQSWDGVRQAAVSAVREGEQRAALVEAARGIARADGAQVWELAPDGNLMATESAGQPPRERRLRLPEAVREELREDWPSTPGGLLGAIEGPVLAATGTPRAHLEPMLSGGRIVGFLSVTWDTYVTGVGDDARSVLALLAAHAALVVERTELERSARTDVLTGLPNRRAFEDELRREMSRATRMRVPLTVALLDLDGFKELNDTAGHAAGDAALRAAADAWAHGLRSMDVLARYGGDEFAVLLPNCSLPEAQEVLDRMRLATPLGLGASIGLTSWHEGEPAEQLIGRADTALYASKRTGRNRTTALEPDGDGAAALREVG
jgi:diguanylate cyclase (GGDEF)-like protein